MNGATHPPPSERPRSGPHANSAKRSGSRRGRNSPGWMGARARNTERRQLSSERAGPSGRVYGRVRSTAWVHRRRAIQYRASDRARAGRSVGRSTLVDPGCPGGESTTAAALVWSSGSAYQHQLRGGAHSHTLLPGRHLPTPSPNPLLRRRRQRLGRVTASDGPASED